MEGTEYDCLSSWLGVHFEVKLIRVDELVFEQDAEKVVVLFLYCIVKRCLPSLVPRVEVEDWLVVVSIDLDALANGLELALSHGHVQRARLQGVNEIEVDRVAHFHDFVKYFLRHFEVLFVLHEQ